MILYGTILCTKKKSDEYFYGFEENSKTPKFGEFNLSLIHIFDNSDSAEECQKILKSKGHLDVLVVELTINLNPIIE